ncbi:hypothetical protein D3C85_684700 [compost metagenome]
MVPPYSLIASSQRSGRARKYAGDINTQGTPLKIGCSRPPISPMSWYSGNQLTITSSGFRSMPNPRRISSSLATRLPWLTCTPLGNAVEPEVYCRKAMSSACRHGTCQRSASERSNSSMHSHCGACTVLSSLICCNESRRSVLVSNRRGSAS